MTISRICCVCNKKLSPALASPLYPDDADTPPSEGIVFHTKGNYGSGVLDIYHASNITLMGFICDVCLIDKQECFQIVEEVHEITRQAMPWKAPKS